MNPKLAPCVLNPTVSMAYESRRNSWADLSSGESPVVSLGRNNYPEWSKSATGQGLLMCATWYNHGDNRNKLGSPTVVIQPLGIGTPPPSSTKLGLMSAKVWENKTNHPQQQIIDVRIKVSFVFFLGGCYTVYPILGDVGMLLDSLRISQITFRVLVDVAWQSSPVVILHSQFPQILSFACFRKIYTGGTVL